MQAFTKVLRVGTVPPDSGNSRASLYVKVEYTEDRRLSISGVIGPLASGHARGGCGQINMEFEHRNPQDNDQRTYKLIKASSINYADGWDIGKWLDLLDVWKEYHLNDMQPGCAHQRKENWGKAKVSIVKVNVETWRIRDKTEREGAERTLAGHKQLRYIPYPMQPAGSSNTYMGRLITKCLNQAKIGKVYHPKDSAEQSWFDGGVISIVVEEKLSGRVYSKEHPLGVLGKECPICGYEYGTAWRKMEIPDSILDFLKSLPDSDKVPAWI